MPEQEKNDLVRDIISRNEKCRTAALNLLYKKNFGLVKTMALKFGGTIEIAEDIFQEGVTILYQNLQQGKFKEESSVHTYLFNICRYRFYNLIKKQGEQLVPLTDYPDHGSQAPEIIDPKKVSAMIKELKIGCQQILLAFYYENRSMSQIAKTLSLGSDQVARNKKARCMKALMAKVKDRKLTLESFVK